MALMHTYLRDLGFELWDLGMCLDYKTEKYGGVGVPRADFLKRLAALRDLPSVRVIDLETRKNGGEFQFRDAGDKEERGEGG